MKKQIYNNFVYSLIDDEIIIEDYKGDDININIPEFFNINNKEFPVVKLANKEMFSEFVESIYIPKSISFIGLHVFDLTKNLKHIIVDDNNLKYKSEDDILYNKKGDILIKYAPSKENKKVIIKDTVKKIKDCAFLQSKNIEELMMSNKIDEIGFEAFGFCENLKDIRLSNKIEVLKRSTFINCKKLKNINFPDNLERIGANCFSDCSELESFKAPKSLKSIGRYTFYNCKNLKNVDIKNSKLTYILDNVFRNTDLDTFYISSSIKTIGYNSFTNIKNLYIENPQIFSKNQLILAIQNLQDVKNIVFGSIDDVLTYDLKDYIKGNVYEILDIEQLDMKGFSFSQINQILNGYENQINLSLLSISLDVDIFRSILRNWNNNTNKMVELLINLKDEKDIDKIIENFKQINELENKKINLEERVR